MVSNQVIVFDIWSNYAYFRKPYTTTTALTYSFIPRSTIEGLVCAILGIDRYDIYNELIDSKIGLRILSEVKKIPFSTIHTHSDFWSIMGKYVMNKIINIKKEFRTRINLELLINPKYRIYFSDKKYNLELETKLKNHQTVYTPYLGTSTMIANFEYINTFDLHTHNKNNEKFIEISSIVPYINKIPTLMIEKDRIYAIEQNIPAKINKDRDLISSYSAIYNPTNGKIKVKDIEYQSINYTNIVKEDSVENFVFIPSQVS